ncbi:hypothetical protein EXIGLDRAFT_766299, partial [Exidia glandulosa HHB12029]
MASKLADELLKEILSPPLLVPDELFADTGAVSPFSKATYSAADVLAVCKRWMRVATPALYQTVIIRSTAQAEALAFALKCNPDFGRYIKKLRIEGAFGPHLGKIAPVSPNITDFCLSLAIYSDARVTGLIKLMIYINPERVILTTAATQVLRNDNHTKVLKTLCVQISEWTNLHAFHYSSPSDHGIDGHVNMIAECDLYPVIAEALAGTPSLRTVHLYPPTYPRENYWSRPLQAFVELSRSTAITGFFLLTPNSMGYDVLQRCIPSSMHTRLRIVKQKLEDSIVPQNSRPSPSYIPLSNTAPATRSAILSRIISHAVLRPAVKSRSRENVETWFDPDYFTWKTAKSLLSTSRSFFDLTAPILLEHVTVSNNAAQLSVLRRYLEQFHVAPSAVLSVQINASPTIKLPADAVPTIMRLTSLQSATMSACTPIIAALGLASGPALTRLTIESRRCKEMNITALSQFQHLTTLCFEDRLGIGTKMNFTGDLPPYALPRLRVLNIHHGRKLLQKLMVCG